VKVEIADPSEFPSKVPRPMYSVLENVALKARGMNCFRPWQEGLQKSYISAEGAKLPSMRKKEEPEFYEYS